MTIAPDLQRRHAGLVIGHLTQFKLTAYAAVGHQLGHGVGQSARSHVMYKHDGIVFPELPAGIDHLLTATLHLGVAALYGSKIQAF